MTEPRKTRTTPEEWTVGGDNNENAVFTGPRAHGRAVEYYRMMTAEPPAADAPRKAAKRQQQPAAEA